MVVMGMMLTRWTSPPNPLFVPFSLCASWHYEGVSACHPEGDGSTIVHRSLTLVYYSFALLQEILRKHKDLPGRGAGTDGTPGGSHYTVQGGQ